MRPAPPTRRLVVGAAENRATVQRVLHDRLEISHAAARGMIAAGCVRRNGRAVAGVAERVAEGDRLDIAVDAGRNYARAPGPARGGEGFRVVHEDDDLVVVDKEPGLLTVPAGAAVGDSLHERLLETYRKRGHRAPRLWVVHRIDRFTSGLVVFARSHPAYRHLKDQFKARTADRIYLAVAEGAFDDDRGRLSHLLAENPKSLKVEVVPREAGGRPATLAYRVLERLAGATLLEVTLVTGRRNQIRVQLAAEGHPLVGDVAYGRPSPTLPRVALHAHRLSFTAPRGRKRLRFESPLPRDLTRWLAARRRGTPQTAAAAPSEKRRRTPL